MIYYYIGTLLYRTYAYTNIGMDKTTLQNNYYKFPFAAYNNNTQLTRIFDSNVVI